ncbi:MAG: hypothetical protein O9320_20585 [Magnetospirillum sp.]|nr:hypothetical protein [Magnetospirillum sp.]
MLDPKEIPCSPIKNTLVLLVTCSQDESRRVLAEKVAQNISTLASEAGLASSLVLFDNASKYTDHLKYMPAHSYICCSERNIGYWSAIDWVLRNRDSLGGRGKKYLYIVESDLWHDSLLPLAECEAFLDLENSAVGVRTQEFSVRGRWRYDKGLSHVPFRKRRSLIHLVNQATGEKAWFKKTSLNNLWLSNIHAKLPALNRIDALENVFRQLAARETFSEVDFFRLMMAQMPRIGILDGGIWHQLSTLDTSEVTSGSWSSEAELKKLGYQTTRTASIDRTMPIVSVRVVGSQA